MERGTVLSGVNDNPHRFNGEYRDWERGHGNTGEYYLRARSYSPRVGRFTQPDPHWNPGNMQSSPNAIHQAANLYAFGINNPVKWIDPSGRIIELPRNYEERNTIMYHLRQLTRDTLSYERHESASGWISYTLAHTAVDGDSLSHGTQLIRDLINSEHTLTIEITARSSGARRNNSINASIPGVGTGGTIYFNPNEVTHAYVAECPFSPTFIARIEPHITLGHELIHGYRYTQGIWASGRSIHGFRDPDGIWDYTRDHRIEELYTIGITNVYWRGNYFVMRPPGLSENALRREQGMPIRLTHRFARP